MIDHFYESVPGWFDFEDVYRDAVASAPSPAHFVEVGAWLGRSTAFLAVEIARSGKPIRLDVVDHWEGSVNEPAFRDVLRATDVYHEFEGHMRRGGVWDALTVVRGDSAAAAAGYADGSLDFVFIDGSHDYASVRRDVLAWLPKVRPGGTLAGHDWGRYEVAPAVRGVLPEAAVGVRGSSWVYTVPGPPAGGPPATPDHLHAALADRGRLEAFCRARVRVVPVEGSRAAVRVLGGPLLLLDMRDVQIAVHLAMDGFWESWITLAVARHVRPGWRCADVGANCGYFTVLLGSLVGAAGRVWAWEPNPDLALNLRETVRLNGLNGWTEVVEAAATDRPGECRLQLLGQVYPNTLNGSIVWENPAGRVVPVAGRTLDEVCGGHPVDFVKIDVEGAEELTWEGMREVRRANPGVVILLEFNAARYADAAAFVARIQADGFVLRSVDYDGSIRPVGVNELLALDHGDWMLWLTRLPD